MNKKPTGPPTTTLNLLRQICNLNPEFLVAKIARETKADKKARTFSPWSRVVSLYIRKFVCQPATLFCAFPTEQLPFKSVPALRPCVSAGTASAVAARLILGAVTVRSTAHLQACNTSRTIISIALAGS